MGANINIQDKYGKTVLDFADTETMYQGKKEAIYTLFSLGATNAQDKNGKTFLDNYQNLDEIATVIASSKDSGNISNSIINIIKQGSGYISDSSKHWQLVENIINNCRDRDVDVVSKALEGIDNTSRRDRLLSFLPENKRSLVNISPTMWESVRETANLAFGNSSIDIPQREHKEKSKKRSREEDGQEENSFWAKLRLRERMLLNSSLSSRPRG